MPEKLLEANYGLSDSELSKATAKPSDVLSGKTFYSGSDSLLTGTLVESSIVDTIYYSSSYMQIGSNTQGPKTFKLNHKYDYFIVCSLWWTDNTFPTISVINSFPYTQTMNEYYNGGLTQTRKIDLIDNTLYIYPSSRSDGNGGLLKGVFGIRSK